jgi:hypothetical protein
MKRLEQVILIVSFIPFSWLAMQAVHELGHVLGALVSGGEVASVILHPLTISCTILSRNPKPLLVVWAGPVIGVAIPLFVFLIAKTFRIPGTYLFRFFAGFCLVANGAYIGLGAFSGLADAGDMLRHGSYKWHLILFGLIAFSIGLYLWNGLGPKFGLGKEKGEVSRPAAYVSLALFIILSAVEIIMGG